MQKAIRIAQELVNNETEVTPEKTQQHMDRLKPEINNLLHQFLPDDIMLKEVEVLAMVINEMVWNPHSFLGLLPNEKEPKQETLEEAAERLYPIKIESCMEGKIDVNSYERNLFIEGAKWQQEQAKE